MNIMGINSLSNYNATNKKFTAKPAFAAKNNAVKDIFDKALQEIPEIQDPKNIFQVTDATSSKVGKTIVLTPNDPEFKDLKILIKDGTKCFKSEDFEVTINKEISQNPSFKGHVWGSIGANNYPRQMRKAYSDFFNNGMFKTIIEKLNTKTPKIKNDYNFFVPTDGNGTRFKDYTDLQGGICKPAATLPANLNGHPLKLIHATLINFAKTAKLQSGARFINVDKARGSAFAFLEGLKSGKLPTNKPLVFCWGDNFSDINLTKLIEYHEKQHAGLSVLGIGVNEERMKSLGAIYLNPHKGFEIQGFKEKPQSIEEIEPSALPGKKEEYLASVGPFVFSPEVLKHLKKEYKNDPSQFHHDSGEFDFSRKVLTPLVKKLREGKIVGKNGEKLPMMAYLKPDGERWGDLGKTTDLIEEMQAVKAGKYLGLPEEIQKSISKNVDDRGILYQDEKTKELFERFCKKYNVEIKDAQMVVWGK